MKRITLNFHDGQARRNRAVGWILLVLSVLLGVSLLIQYNKMKAEQQRIQTMLIQQQDHQRSVHNDTNAKEMSQKLERAAAVIYQLAFPWDALFRVLELSMNEEVVLLSVVPDVKGCEITLNGEAKDWSAMQDYVRRLGADTSFFSAVNLVSHQVQQNDPQNPVRFVLSCSCSVAE
ncbi:MAG: PilN domain-containing protein [Gallionella sp.]|nr:PilN domain-containing protein [Gallionella sp.]